ncbi:MAG: glycosyltransferase, partial [Thermofilaceae archaeon]
VSEYKPDVVTILFSVWVEPYKSFPRIMQQLNSRVKVLVYAPFEYLTLSELFFESLLGAHLVLIPNRIGEAYMKLHVGEEFVWYVPHGYDPRVFKPLRRSEMTDVERQYYDELKRVYDGRTVYLFVGRNNLRKEIGTLIAAFRMLPSRIRRESMLALYTRLQEVTPSTVGASLGWDIVRIAKKYGVDDRVFVFHNWASAEWGVPDWLMNIVYNSADIYVHPSSGEGFGLPIIEAMAVGLPVIASANTSMLEFCGENEEYCLLAEPMVMLESWEGFSFTPTNPVSLSEKMEQMHDSKVRKHYSQKSLERARQYTWEKAVEHYEQALDYVQDRTARIERYRHDVIPEDYMLNPYSRRIAERMKK